MSQIRDAQGLLCLVFLFAVSVHLPNVGAQCRLNQRRITVADAIKMTEVAPPEPESSAQAETVGSFSPDGRHFAVVLKVGTREKSANVYTLQVFATEETFRGHRPQDTVTMVSDSNQPGIADLHWLNNSHTLMFLGEELDSPAQIYSFDLETRRTRRLTTHPTSVVRYDASGDGQVIVFEAEPPPVNVVDGPGTKRSGFIVRGEELSTILFSGNRDAESMAFSSRELFIKKGSERPRRVVSEDGIWPFLTLSVSPDGRYALVGALVRKVPQEWGEYSDPVLHRVIVAHKSPQSVSQVQINLLLDTSSGSITRLLDAPIDWAYGGYLWLNGSKSLVVSNAYLPLEGLPDAERGLRLRQPFVVEVELPTRRFVTIGSENLSAASWNERDREITLTGLGKVPSIRKFFRRRGDHWEEIAAGNGDTARDRYQLSIVQDMNVPPQIWLSDALDRRTRLPDLNPQFNELCFGREEEITWKATDGHEVHGGLYLPPDFVPTHRYPLVIQTHGFNSHEFWMDGPWHGAFAAQPLAAKGIVVLQMGYDHVGAHTPEEAPRAMAAIDGAIDSLSQKGIVDPDRVGIIGFSRTVYHVAYTLTHSSHRFAAATLADGFDGDYFQFIVFPSTEGTDAAAVNGGPPFGKNLEKWIARSPLFDIEAVRCPVRLEAYGMDSVLGLWAWYSLLSQRAMPVDMIVLPSAPHLLEKPWDRMVSQQGNVDWFLYWLKGDRDPAPGKAEEYERWELLRPADPGAQSLNRPFPGEPR